MKKQHEKKLWKIKDNMKKVPLAISGCGSASANIQSYISAYRDLEKEHEYVCCFLDYLQQMMFWKDYIKTVDEYDKPEIQETIDYCKGKMQYYFDEYNSWIEERINQRWD